MTILPKTRPEMGRHAAEELLHSLKINIAKPSLLGRRGYYRDTMGTDGANDIGLYDDAIIFVSPTAYATFNANCDPTRLHPGVATLKAGVWRYKLGIHGLSRAVDKQYEALVQAGPVTVRRWQLPEENGWFGINIHRGGYNVTSSEGCQTIYPDQWDAFIALVKGELLRHAAVEIPYALTER